MTPAQKDFLVLTFPAQGQLNPALQFAKRLIDLGSRVTLLTTVSIFRRAIHEPTIDGLTLASYSDGYDDGFTDTTDDAKVMIYFSELNRRGKQALTNLMASKSNEGHPFTGLIYTLYLPWAAEVARSLHVSSALLWVQPAVVLDIFYYYLRGYADYIDGKSKDPESEIKLPGLPLLTTKDIPSFLQPSNIYSFAIPALDEHFRELEKEVKPRVLVNTFEALESEAIRAVDKLNMIPIGPLIPSAFLDRKYLNDTSFGVDIFCRSSGYIEWLDSHAERSVVYVSFGSLAILSEKQTKEIARALLDSGSPFLWVIRDSKVKKGKKQTKEEEKLSCIEKEKKLKKNGDEEENSNRRENEKKEEEDVNCGEQKTLDSTEREEEKEGNEEEEEGWRKELEEKGRIVNWCSQLEVLSHRAVGCFVTHCGWNSTVESLVSGVPTVAIPQWTDQGTNAKMIEDLWKTGRRVEVNEEGVAESEEIRRCLDVVLGNEEKGVEMRKNARKWKELAREAVKEGSSSDKNLRAFVNDIARC